MKSDVIVIGAGTSGMMAAISAAKAGAKVIVLEKNKKVGKKLLLTGGGRCNVTNNRSAMEIIEHIPGNGKFLYSAFSQFDNQDIMTFFEENGVSLKEEDHGRMFPVSNRSKTIVDCLYEQMIDLDVTLLTNTSVKKVNEKSNNITGVTTDTGAEISAPCVIISTGGKTYQHTGSSGDGYRFAKQMGHHITPLFPTESPLVSNEKFIQNKTLQGLALQDVSLSVLDAKGKLIVTHEMDLLFTHFGLSGPAALRCSMFVQKQLENESEVSVVIDSFPHKTNQEVMEKIIQLKHSEDKKSIKNALKNLLPERYLEFLLDECSIDKSKPIKQIENNDIDKFVDKTKSFKMKVSATWPLEKSFVTGGGVSLKEVQPKTMESKRINGLFFTGELLDINGYTGGYNITAAFVTGFVAGKHAAQIASYSSFE